ncbi:hypothetical protein LCGC14_1868390, partial [marine sediment metagenome]
GMDNSGVKPDKFYTNIKIQFKK